MTFIRGLALFILAVGLLIVLAPFGMLLGVLGGGGKYLYDVARSIDQTGNAICGDLLTIGLLRRSATDIVPFGNMDTTVSDILYRNKLKGSLNTVGKILEWLLETIDPGHLANAFEEDEV